MELWWSAILFACTLAGSWHQHTVDYTARKLYKRLADGIWLCSWYIAGAIRDEEEKMKKILAIIAIVTFGFWTYHKFQNNKADLEQFVHNNLPAKAPERIAPKTAGLDVSALARVTERLIANCANNQNGLTEQECVQTINARKDLCRQLTVQTYPEQPSSLDGMQVVISSHTDCLFQNATAAAN
jgi:hypothetical protein